MSYPFAWLLLYFSLFALTLGAQNNACKTFPDYYKELWYNPNCFYNADVNDNVPSIVKRHGYPIRNHTVTTSDGYILSLFRIPYGNNPTNSTRQPIFLAHGIGGSSVLYVFMRYKSLAFNLVDNGYDVWLGNFRGCQYADRHKHFTSTQRKYWGYSLNEVGIYDVPAQIDFIIGETGQKVIYIGYSMGTTANFIYSSEFPDEASQKIKLAVNLAPIANLHFATTPATALVFITPIYYTALALLQLLTNGVLQQRTPQFLYSLKAFCLPYPIQISICSTLYSILFGYDPSQEDSETFPVTFYQGRDAIGLRMLIHYTQIIKSGKFQKYDFGAAGNIRQYGTQRPPIYNLTRIKVVNYFIRGDADPLATGKNTEKTYLSLDEAARPFEIYTVNYSGFTHLDFIQAKDVKTLLNDHIIEFLQNTLK